MNLPKPKRRFEVTITISADSWSEVVSAHDDLLPELTDEMIRLEKTGERMAGHLNGGANCSYSTNVTHDPNQTHDSYFKQVHEWLKKNGGELNAAQVSRTSEGEVREEKSERSSGDGNETRSDA